MKDKILASIIRFLKRLLPTAKRVVINTPLLFQVARFLVRLALRSPGIGPLTNRVVERIIGDRGTYAEWITHNDPHTPADFAAIRGHIALFKIKPLISVVMPTYNTGETVLREAITSVIDQLYPNWELCIADDASTNPKTWQVLEEFVATDSRIKIVRRQENGHICHAGNSALALAAGDFVALMDHDDRLPVHALYEVASEINTHPDVDLIFSDEDKFDDAGVRSSPYFKAGWDPELMLSQNVVNHLAVYRRSTLNEIGGFRPGFEGSQDYDLTLRFSERTTADRIRHIPTVLYHWRQGGKAKSFSESQLRKCAETAQRAVSEHLERTGVKGASVIVRDDMPGWIKVERPLPAELPRVSVIIPTRDRADLLTVCLDGLLHKTDYDNLEVVVVNNASVEQATFALFKKVAADNRVKILNIDGKFNYSLLNNRAVAAATGEIILLLNNDIEVIEPGWLKAMVAQAIRPEVGAVGARLLYGNGRVQHAGVIVGAGASPTGKRGIADHILKGSKRQNSGYFGVLYLAHEVSAVTGACLALRREVFEKVGGLDEEALAVAFNDVDLCLKIRARGYKIIWTPLAELYHHESASRGPDSGPEKQERFQGEIATMDARWGAALDADPYYNPNLSLFRANYQITKYSRRQVPWSLFFAFPRHEEVFVLRTSVGQDLKVTVSVCRQLAGDASRPPILLDVTGDQSVHAALASTGQSVLFLTTRNPDIHDAVSLAIQVSEKAKIYAFSEDMPKLSRVVAEFDPGNAKIEPAEIPEKCFRDGD